MRNRGTLIIQGVLILLHVALAFNFSPAHAQQYGLHFASYDSTKEKRTGLDLFPGNKPTFRDDFELSFDISFYASEAYKYGYVFRAILNEEHNLDLIYDHEGVGELFTIVNNHEETDISFLLNPEDIIGNWLNFRIQFRLSEDKILFHVRDETYIHENAGLDPSPKVEIYFGANNDKEFTTTDVPPIHIRDIKVYRNKKLRYHWPLGETSGDFAGELIRNKHAKADNPVWLTREHMQWKPVKELALKGYAPMAANFKDNILYFWGREKLISFDAESETTDTVALSEYPFLFMSYYQAVFDGKHIISYDQDAGQLIKLDPQTGSISNTITTDSRRKNFLHHNKYLDTAGNSLYVINGYGYYSYRNDISMCNLENNQWQQIPMKGNPYAPRYLAASGRLNDTLYVLGGYGSTSGSQKLNPRYFYDLNTITLDSFVCDKKWDYVQPETDFCFANSLVIDSITRNFYALSFPKHKFESKLQLVRGSLDEPTLSKIRTGIPYRFNDINSFADLFYFPELNKLFAVTLYSKNYEQSSVKIYSMNYPPIAEEKMVDEDKSGLIDYIPFVLLILVMALIIVLWIRRKRKTRDYAGEIPLEEAKNAITNNAIFFFGGFQVLNRDGEDITRKFTKLIKELFLLILFRSAGNSKGISAERLIEELWFDKDEKSGRNNLSVNLAKLKEILKEIDGCSLDHKTSYWKFIVDRETVYVEYLEIMNIHEKKERSYDALRNLLVAANKGQFLLNLDYEWLDRYKGKVSDIMVDTLIAYAESLDPKKESSLIIQITNSVFNFDSVNEEAMVLKCRTQSILGKHSLCRKTYENFCKEYELIYGESFKRPFRSVINDK